MPKILIPEELRCPITQDLFKKPIRASDGCTYEETAITEWVKRGGTSPVTRQSLDATFTPDEDKQKEIEQFFKKNNLCTQQQFLQAMLNGDISQVNYPDNYLFEATDSYGNTALHLAAAGGHVELVKQLLAEGVNLEACDYNGDTPLHCAAMRGQDKVVKVLIEAGANTTAWNKNNLAPLNIATLYGQDKVEKTFIACTPDRDGVTPLHRAAKYGYPIEGFIEDGANPNAVDKNGFTPLHYAVQNNQYEVVKKLIDAGAVAAATKSAPASPQTPHSETFRLNFFGVGSSTTTTTSRAAADKAAEPEEEISAPKPS
ncbi:MAG: ankyrin repeat domain-containing protein [Gammaproteobacteria bacterium]